METLQFNFILLVIGILVYLVIDGWKAQSVWVKGARDGRFNMRKLAHRRSREEDPWTFAFAMCFYAITALILVLLLLFR